MKKTLLIRLLCNYRNTKTNLSFKNYIKQEIGEDWVYKLATYYKVSHNEIGNQVKELTLLNTYLEYEKTKWLVNDLNE